LPPQDNIKDISFRSPVAGAGAVHFHGVPLGLLLERAGSFAARQVSDLRLAETMLGHIRGMEGGFTPGMLPGSSPLGV
jgi:hypothetical protein